MQNFSVLMSIYKNTKLDELVECLDSIFNQSVKSDDIVIVFDGPVPNEVEAYLDELATEHAELNLVKCEVNRGLGPALATGMEACKNELIARMDTDDIAVPNRFELQLNAFEEDPDLDICGGQIAEFETTPDDIIGERRVPLTHDEIVEYQKKRCAFNHMTVMYKKSKVLEAGNYKHCPLMEDDLLWVDMILAGAKCVNLDEYLCKVRTNRDMIARRGGLKYYKKYKAARKRILDTGFITKKQYRKTNRIQLIVCMMPKWLRKKVFFGLLHKKTTKTEKT
ncbi:MAG: glycosyltransferase [Clostridiales bacterium]|nr:glycosyltransferase [Clostridiales bacterium]